MRRFISEEEIAEIIALHKQGKLIKEIAQKLEVCEASVSNHIHGKTNLRGLVVKKRKAKQNGVKVVNHLADPYLEEEDFSKLPDSVLFEHVREFNFIG